MSNSMGIRSKIVHEEAYSETVERRSLLVTNFDMPSANPLPREWEAFLAALRIVSYAPQADIVREGEQGDALYVIESGMATVWQEDKQGGRRQVGELHKGDIIGELSLLTGASRAATVSAVMEVSAIRLNRQDFEDLLQAYPSLSGLFLSKNYKRLSASYYELEQKNGELITALHARVELSSLFICVVLLMSVYAFILGFFKSDTFLSLSFANTLAFVLTRFLEVITLLIILWILRSSRMPLREFGVNANDFGKTVFESILVSAAVVVGLIALKYGVLQLELNPFPNQILINWHYWDWTYVSYIVVAPLQEFIARGVFQNTVARLIVSKRAVFWSILITSVLFGALHLHTSIGLGMAAFMTSWLWGWMFARQRTLIGVGLSHFIIGNCAGLLGFWTIF
ncbi:cyclic nucleotide-binding domain-containing protein [Paenibacillus sp. N3.4]|uniref:cyclic nucleotide-binding domain-containing protein n=1 Tax=Paenibacillus sp. N3.4 TaxID=2603222 RepID=UPI0011CBEA16|nr:cyclic nucleotide-binding domain-containing protein [Paenibacillus sp. N3.4]TXK76410.1 cyclic nucleotide-binding domain-containing protein [Paenibacillus sp. N3.4]